LLMTAINYSLLFFTAKVVFFLTQGFTGEPATWFLYESNGYMVGLFAFLLHPFKIYRFTFCDKSAAKIDVFLIMNYGLGIPAHRFSQIRADVRVSTVPTVPAILRFRCSRFERGCSSIGRLR
jgi:hypothetical protein